MNKILKNFHLDELDFLKTSYLNMFISFSTGLLDFIFFFKEEEILVSISKMS